MASDVTAGAIPDSEPGELSQARRIAILATVVLSATIYSTTILIVAAVLPQLQGALSATPDEISWTVTFNILATAVTTPVTGWLAGRFGRRRLLVGSVLLCAISTYFCGAATSLESLIFWRIVQGVAGAPLPPLAQTIVLDTFPKRQHGMAVGVYGIGVVMGGFIGPMIGGVMAEWYTWRYAFYIIVPVATISAIGVHFALPADRKLPKVRLEWTGFVLLSTSIACIQLILSRGQRLDWFDSPEIIAEAFLAVLTMYLFVVHSLTTDRPFLNLKLLLNKNYAIGLILVTVYGMLNFTPMVILPGLLREHLGMPDSLIGYIVGSRGIGAMAGFFAAMFIGQKYPRKSIFAGFIFQVIAGVWLTTVNLNTAPMEFVLNGIIQGFSVGMIWVPLTVVTFSTLDPKDLPESTAVFHLLRNIGSSFFISMSVTEIVRSGAMNYEHMTEMVTPYALPFQLPWATGEWDMHTIEGLARLSKQIAHQASMISYLNAFGLYTMVSAVSIPLILLVSRPQRTQS